MPAVYGFSLSLSLLSLLSLPLSLSLSLCHTGLRTAHTDAYISHAHRHHHIRYRSLVHHMQYMWCTDTACSMAPSYRAALHTGRAPCWCGEGELVQEASDNASLLATPPLLQRLPFLHQQLLQEG